MDIIVLMFLYAFAYGFFEYQYGESYTGDEYRKHVFRFTLTGMAATPLFAMLGWYMIPVIIAALIAGMWKCPLPYKIIWRRILDRLHVTTTTQQQSVP
jgi:hypothetical protein